MFNQVYDLSAYIGRPYDGFEYNCWHFFCEIQATLFDRQLPEFVLDPNDLRGIIHTFHQAEERQNWSLSTQPKNGDAVLMRRARFALHIGCWFEQDGGHVLHAQEGVGVAYQSENSLISNGWNISGYYRYLPLKKRV